MLVVVSGLIHSVWNLFAKRSDNKAVFLWFCQWAAIIVFLPLAIRELGALGHPIRASGWIVLGVAVFFHGAYVLLLTKTYSLGDLSQVYPIMRGTSPLLVPLIGVGMLGERLSPAGWIGVVCIVTGVFAIGEIRLVGISRFKNNGVLWALGVGLMIAGYTVFDKLALQTIPPFALNEASNIGNFMALSWSALSSGAIREEWRINWKTIILGGIMAPGGYVLFLKALQIMPVAQIAPMREIGTVFGTLLGVFILREAQGKRRIGAAVIIVVGVILLAS